MTRSSVWLLWQVVLWAALAAILGARLVGAETVPASVALALSTEPAPGSEGASLSTDGRYVAFFSPASNLVEDDTNGFSDAFAYDTLTGTVTRVSVDSAGSQANGYTDECAISGNGRYVAFASWATNLVTGDTSGTKDIFVHDLQTGATTQVSVASDGTQSDDRSLRPSISADGRYVAFASLATNLVANDTNGTSDVFVHDRLSGETVRATVSSAGEQTSGFVYQVCISADGRHVAFASNADNLVAGDTNGTDDVFLRDLDAGSTVRVSVSNDEAQANSYSGDPEPATDAEGGHWVVFVSAASNLVAGDSNGTDDVFVRDLGAGTTERVSVDSSEAQCFWPNSAPALSDDGRFVAFESACPLAPPTLVVGQNIFVRDRLLGTTVQASLSTAGNEGVGMYTHLPDISGDGSHVAFHSSARYLVPGDTNDGFDVFVRDIGAATLERAPAAAAAPLPGDLALADGPSGVPDEDESPLSMAENRIAFASHAANLVEGDGNERIDVFVHNLEDGTTLRASLADDEAEANADTLDPALSGNGRYVAFESVATNLVAVDANEDTSDVFLRDLESGTTEVVSLSNSGYQEWGDSTSPTLSADGRYVAFVSASDGLVAYDYNGQQDVFVRDRLAGTTTLVSVTPGGVSGNITSWSPVITPDGRFVVFLSYAHNLIDGGSDNNPGSDVFRRDLQTGVTIRASADSPTTDLYGQATAPAVSADGRYVAFYTGGSWLVPGDTNETYDVFVFDCQTGLTERVSVHSSGAEAHGYNWYPAISADGRYVAFSSTAYDLVDGVPANQEHVYLHDRAAHATRLVSVKDPVATEAGASGRPAISSEGLRIAYVSEDWNQVAGDANGLADVFRWTLLVAADTFEDGTLCSWDTVVGGPPCP